GYSKAAVDDWKMRRNLLDPSEDGYSNPDGDARGPWKSIPFSAQGSRKNQRYTIMTPTGRALTPPKGRCWGATEPEFIRLRDVERRVYWPKDGDGLPRIKQFPDAAKGLVPDTLWLAADVGDTEGSKKQLLQIFAAEEDFGLHAPKPVELIERLVAISARSDSIVLDSFAGSGTTAHAVLKANAADGGSRRFILVEGEDYADRLTAERVRRAIKGYAWVGTQKESLLEQKITFIQLKKAGEWLAKVEAIKAREGFAEGDLADQGASKNKRFDKISVKLDDGVLRVEGEKKISERVEGLDGAFTFCTLGEPLDLDKLLSGESLPAWSALGAWLFHTATGGTLPPAPKNAPKWYLGESRDAHVWLVYEPSLAFLTSPEAALTLSLAKSFHDWGVEHDAKRGERKRHLVFAPAKYLSNRQLAEHAVDYAPLPFALYREA
ncbi:MAG: DNA methyltransferase, partial [Lysobacteraceae bacterium]